MQESNQKELRWNRARPVPFFEDHSRFLKFIKTNQQSDCWNWTGAVTNGYGRFTINRKSYRAHRISYTIFKGSTDPLKVIDHTCKNKICCNPDHLREITIEENIHGNCKIIDIYKEKKNLDN